MKPLKANQSETRRQDDTQVYKQFVENESFRRFITDMVFTITSD